VAATLPRLVGHGDLPAATAARTAIQSGSVIIGPAGGALLLLLGSPAAAFLINAATFAVSAAILWRLPGGWLFTPSVDRDAPDGAPTGVFREVWAGVTAMRGNGSAARLMGADVMCSLLYGAQTVLLLLLGRKLGYGDAGYGYMLAGVGIGGLVGAGLAPRISAARPRQAISAVLVAIAVPSALLAVTPWLGVAVVLAAAVGAGSIVVEVVADTALARALDEEVLARAYGLAFPASIAGILVGSLIAAPLVAFVGLSGALVVVAGLVAAYAIVLWLPARRRQPAQYVLRADAVDISPV
jgi:predicted MFS family arabinose efflux permease